MEIKINCTESFTGKKIDGAATHIFQGKDIVHRSVGFENLKDFQERYSETTKHTQIGHVIGVPKFYWNNLKEIKKEEANVSGSFLYIHFIDENGSFRFIVVKNAKVYITSKGQTVDKVLI